MCIFGLLCVFHSLQAQPSYSLSPASLPVFLFQWPHFPHVHDKTFLTHFPFINTELLKPVLLLYPWSCCLKLIFCYRTASFMKLSFPWLCHCWLISSYWSTMLSSWALTSQWAEFYCLVGYLTWRTLAASLCFSLWKASPLPDRFLEPRLTYDTDWFVSCLCSKSSKYSFCLKSKCVVSMASKAFSLCNKYLNTKEDHESLLRPVRLTQQSNEKEAGV